MTLVFKLETEVSRVMSNPGRQHVKINHLYRKSMSFSNTAVEIVPSRATLGHRRGRIRLIVYIY